MNMADLPHSLTILTHVVHYRWQGVIYAYTPYAREVEVWARLFARVNLAAPCRPDTFMPPADCSPIRASNLRLLPQLERGGNTWQAKAWQIASLPALLWRVAFALWQAEALQVRCPGNLGLLGILLGPLFTRYRVAKYAGQWNAYPGEAFTYRLQRFLLRSRWWGAPTLVYGDWPQQPAHILPFFTSVLDARQVRQAGLCAAQKTLHRPLRLLFVGRLTHEKNVHTLLEALAVLQEQGLLLECHIVGEGPQRQALTEISASLPQPQQIQFCGGLPFEQTLQQYAWADILVLVSQTEGWPKAIAEAMTFGVLCIGSNRGLVPQMLAEGRGLIVEPGNSQALVEALSWVAQNPNAYEGFSRCAAAWGSRYSLASLETALLETLTRAWKATR